MDEAISYNERHKHFQQIKSSPSKQIATDHKAYTNFLETQLERLSKSIIANERSEKKILVQEEKITDLQSSLSTLTEIVKNMQKYEQIKDIETSRNFQNMSCLSTRVEEFDTLRPKQIEEKLIKIERAIASIEGNQSPFTISDNLFINKFQPIITQELERQSNLLRTEFNRKIEAVMNEVNSNDELERKINKLKSEFEKETLNNRARNENMNFSNLEEKLSQQMTSGIDRIGKILKKVVERQSEFEEKLLKSRISSPEPRDNSSLPIITPHLRTAPENEDQRLISFGNLDRMEANFAKSEHILNHCERIANKVDILSRTKLRSKKKSVSKSRSKSKSISASKSISKSKSKSKKKISKNKKSPSKTSKNKSSISLSKSKSKSISKSRSKSKSLSCGGKKTKKLKIKSKPENEYLSYPLREYNDRSNTKSYKSKSNSKSISCEKVPRLCQTPKNDILTKIEKERKLRTAKIKEMLVRQRKLEKQLLSSTKKPSKAPKDSKEKSKPVKIKALR